MRGKHTFDGRFALISFVSLFILACGGGSETESPEPIDTSSTAQPNPTSQPNTTVQSSATPQSSTTSQPSATAQPDIVSVQLIQGTAVEITGQRASFIVTRTQTDAELDVFYRLTGAEAPKGAAGSFDFTLQYEDGSLVGSTIKIPASQTSVTIYVMPEDDNLFEVPESMLVTIENGDGYAAADNDSVQFEIIDAPATDEYRKVFLGNFVPEGDAQTSAAGSASLIISGDNRVAEVNYNFYGLSSQQTDQHMHISPGGTIIKDIEHFGPLTGYQWPLNASGPFTTDQQLLDTLFEGSVYLNIHTADFPRGEIKVTFLYNLEAEPPEITELTADDVDRDIIRFLTQATFGATPDDYQALRSQIDVTGDNRLEVYNQWIDQQIAQPNNSLLALTDSSLAHFGLNGSNSAHPDRRDAFWTLAVHGKDQLRQRMAFALSQILVIGDENNIVRRSHRGTASYWDMLATQGFGQYNELLKDVTKHPIMGHWLSHLRNQKENAELGIFPDENYAREIMQLFSFGLVKRNLDGSIVLGSDNLPAETYDTSVIKELSRVFTGLSFSYFYGNGSVQENNNFLRGSGVNINSPQPRWTEPMRFFPEYRDFGEKTLFTDNGVTVVVPASSDESIASSEAELESVIDAIVAHSSTAPNIARLLIQRFTTSNPSPDYIERVATAFGSTGDLSATIKAILLDPEARNPNAALSNTAGKFKEPVLQLSSVFRLLEVSSRIPFGEQTVNYAYQDRLSSNATVLRMGDLDIGQRALGSVTVFNFYSPEFSPSGELSASGLAAPEMELNTEAQLYSTMNAINRWLIGNQVSNRVVNSQLYTKEDLAVLPDYNIMNTVWDEGGETAEDKAEALLNWMDFYLNAGQLVKADEQETRASIIDSFASETDIQTRNRNAIYALITSPDFMIQR